MMEFFWVHFACLLVFFGRGLTIDLDDKKLSPFRNNSIQARSLFNIIMFPNTVCNTSGVNGTCYTTSECSAKGGTNSGSCANGYGVCCVFSFGCGTTVRENTTYFQSQFSQGSGQCGMTVCKCQENVCQLRLDFITFSITGPSTVTLIDGFAAGGNPVYLTTTTSGVTPATKCLTDTFNIISPGGNAPSVICGDVSGQHVYVEASDDCVRMDFQFGVSGIGTSLQPRRWNIQITQKSCDEIDLPTVGCTQYYYGSTTGTIQSFNFDNGIALANQIQNICFRRERGFCRICFSPSSAIADFAVSGTIANQGFVQGTGCCGYGTNGRLRARAYECVMIPGATVNGVQKPNSICGQRFVTVAAQTISTTICTMQAPFQFSFMSDNWSFYDASTTHQMTLGFKLYYWQTPC